MMNWPFELSFRHFDHHIIVVGVGAMPKSGKKMKKLVLFEENTTKNAIGRTHILKLWNKKGWGERAEEGVPRVVAALVALLMLAV